MHQSCAHLNRNRKFMHLVHTKHLSCTLIQAGTSSILVSCLVSEAFDTESLHFQPLQAYYLSQRGTATCDYDLAKPPLLLPGSTPFAGGSPGRATTDSKPGFELARIRTWNLLIRSQTRYPLRHKPSED